MLRNIWSVLFLLLATGPACSWTLHGGASAQVAATCPKGTSYTNSRGDPDGCLGGPAGVANNTTLIQHSGFFSGGYAAQSGQVAGGTYPVRPLWNVAGVDYAVGIPTSITLKDPSTYGSVAWAALGCTYSATGNNLGGPYLACNLFGSGSTYDLEGFDFSGSLNGHTGGCVDIAFNDVTSSGVGGIIFKNNYFARNSKCAGNSNPSGSNQMILTGNNSVDFENNTVDFSPIVSAAGNNFIPISMANCAICKFKYNAWINIPGDPINGGGYYDQWLEAYDYVENYVFAGDQNHAEHANLSTPAGSPASHSIYEYVTILQGTSTVNGTALSRMSNQVGGSFTFQDGEVLNMVSIANLTGGVGGSVSVDTALVGLNNTQNATIIKDNYVDKTGANHYALAENTSCTTPVAWSGNYDLVSGTTVTASSALDNTGTTPVYPATGYCHQ